MVARIAQLVIQRAALALGFAEQIDIDPIFSAFEIQIDQCTGAAATADARSKHGFVGANLLAHDDDLVPLARGCTIPRRFQALRRLQERILVAPDEVNLQ